MSEDLPPIKAVTGPHLEDPQERQTRRKFLLAVLQWSFFIIIILQYFNIQRSIKAAQELAKSPIEFGEFIPDKEVYHPGEIIRFQYTRIAESNTSQPLPLLMLQIDAFENLDTGEVFPGTTASRIIRKDGTEILHATRQIPPIATPGQYLFEGWASSQTSRVSRAAQYYSKPFTIQAK